MDKRKKIFFILVAILAIIIIGFIILCRSDIRRFIILMSVDKNPDQTFEEYTKGVNDEAVSNSGNYYYRLLFRIDQYADKNPLEAIRILDYLLERHKNAAVFYPMLVPLDGSFGAMAKMLKGDIYQKTKQYDKAIAEYNEIRKVDSMTKIYGDVKKGIGLGPPVAPAGIFALIRIADIYEKQLNDYLSAIAYYHQLIRLYQDEYVMSYEGGDKVGLVAFREIDRITKLRSLDEALKEYDLIKKEARNDELICEVLLARARTSAALKRNVDALRAYREIIIKYPKVAEEQYGEEIYSYYSDAARQEIAKLAEENRKHTNPK